MNDSTRKPDATGQLERHPFPRLLFFLFKKNFLGELEISQPDGWRAQVFFRKGFTVSATLPTTEDTLGRVLLERNLISEESYQRSLSKLAENRNLKQGQILLEMGAIDEEGLASALRLQLRRKLNRIFSITDASYALFNGEHAFGLNADETKVLVDPFAVIYHGVKNHFTFDRIAGELEKMSGMLLKLRPEFTTIQARYGWAGPEESLISLLMRSAIPIEQLMESSTLSPLETQMFIYTLWVTEMLLVTEKQRFRRTSHILPPVHPAAPFKVMDRAGKRGTPSGGVATPTSDRRTSGTYSPAPTLTIPEQERESPPDLQTLANARLKESSSTPKIRDTQPMVASTTPAALSPPVKPSRASLPSLSSDPALQNQHRQRIKETCARMQSQNLFEILGVERNASAEAVRESYFRFAKDFHPDRIQALGLTDAMKEAEEIFRLINEANAVLTSPDRRREYEQKLDQVGDEDVLADEAVQNALAAEIAFQKGQTFFRRKAYSEAFSNFREASRLNPNEGEHVAWESWALFLDPKTPRESTLPKIKKQLQTAVTLSPNNPTCLYFLGEILLASNDEKQAMACFYKVVDLNPDHIEANRQLRLMNMRRDKKKGTISGLFGRTKK